MNTLKLKNEKAELLRRVIAEILDSNVVTVTFLSSKNRYFLKISSPIVDKTKRVDSDKAVKIWKDQISYILKLFKLIGVEISEYTLSNYNTTIPHDFIITNIYTDDDITNLAVTLLIYKGAIK